MKIDYMYCVYECFSSPHLKASQKYVISNSSSNITAAVAVVTIIIIMKCFLCRE